MAIRKVWLGSTGPFLYDDSILYIDEDGVISPDNQQAIATDGQIVIQSAPSSPVHAVRKQDLDDAIGDISGLESRIITLESKTAALEGRMTAAEALNTDQQNAIVALGNRVTNTETTNTNQQTAIGNLTTRMNAVETSNTGQQNDINYLLGHMSSAEANISTLVNSQYPTIITLSYFGWEGGVVNRNAFYTIQGKIVTLNIPPMDGISNDTRAWLGGLTPELRNFSYTFSGAIVVYTESLGWEIGTVSYSGDPSWPLYLARGNQSAWPTTGRRIITSGTIVYHVN